MKVEVITGFDGSCPHFPDGVRDVDEQRAVVLPGCRKWEGLSEELPGKGSRFYTRLVNRDGRARDFCVVADWRTPARINGHDYGYVRHETASEWRMVPGFRVGESRIEYRLSLEPGLTELALFPEFNYSACAGWVERLREQGVPVETIGQSRESRDLWMLSFPSPNEKATDFFLQARDHPYETAGSYCVLGIVGFLRSGSEMADYLRSKFSFSIVPMTNVDGVHNGMSRLTWEQGADMNRINTVADSAHDALKGAMDRVRPSVHMNVHNWTDKFQDGLLANDRTVADKILRLMPADHEHRKHWYVQTTADFLEQIGWTDPPTEEVLRVRHASWSWKNYCKDNFDAIGVNFEFPWFGLNTQAMRDKGVRAFTALALSAIEEMRL